MQVQYDFESTPLNDSDCASLEYPTMVPRALKPLCQGINTVSISPKNIFHPLMVESLLTLTAWLVSGNPFCVKEFQKMFLTLSQIPDKKAHSVIMSQPGENGLARVLNKKLILFRVPVKDYRILHFPFQLWQRICRAVKKGGAGGGEAPELFHESLIILQ